MTSELSSTGTVCETPARSDKQDQTQPCNITSSVRALPLLYSVGVSGKTNM